MAFIICATYVRSKYVIRKYNGQARFRVLSRWNNPPFNQKNFFDVKFDVHQYFPILVGQCITRWSTFPSFKEISNIFGCQKTAISSKKNPEWDSNWKEKWCPLRIDPLEFFLDWMPWMMKEKKLEVSKFFKLAVSEDSFFF